MVEISIQKKTLAAAVAFISGIAAKSNMAITSSVELSVEWHKLADGYVKQLVLSATDLESSASVGVMLEETSEIGEATQWYMDIVSLSQMLAAAPADALLTLAISKAGESSIVCRWHTGKVTKKTLAKEDMIKPNVDTSNAIDVPLQQLLVAYKAVARSVSQDETRPHLCGIRLAADERKQLIPGVKINRKKKEEDLQEMCLQSTDGHRLSISTTQVIVESTFGATVPQKFFSSLQKLKSLRDIASVSLWRDRNMLGIHVPLEHAADIYTVKLATKLVDASWPNVLEVIPRHYAWILQANRAELVDVVKRLSAQKSLGCVLAQESPETLRVETADARDTYDTLSVSWSLQAQPKVRVCVNFAYLLDALESVSGEIVCIKGNGELEPVCIQSENDAEAIPATQCIVMPMRA